MKALNTVRLFFVVLGERKTIEAFLATCAFEALRMISVANRAQDSIFYQLPAGCAFFKRSQIARITVRISLANDHKLFAMNLLVTFCTAETLDVVVVPHRRTSRVTRQNRLLAFETNRFKFLLFELNSSALVQIRHKNRGQLVNVSFGFGILRAQAFQARDGAGRIGCTGRKRRWRNLRRFGGRGTGGGGSCHGASV